MTTRRVPVFPLNTVLYPGTRLPLRIFEDRYHAMLDAVLAEDAEPVFVIASTTDPEVGTQVVTDPLHNQDPSESRAASAFPTPARVGCLARVLQASPPDRERFVLVEGETRTLAHATHADAPYLEADVAFLPEETGDGAASLAGEVRRVLERFLPVLDCVADDLPDAALAFSYHVAAALPVDLAVRQRLLEAPDAATRLAMEARALAQLAPKLEVALKARNAPWN